MSTIVMLTLCASTSLAQAEDDEDKRPRAHPSSSQYGPPAAHAHGRDEYWIRLDGAIENVYVPELERTVVVEQVTVEARAQFWRLIFSAKHQNGKVTVEKDGESEGEVIRDLGNPILGVMYLSKEPRPHRWLNGIVLPGYLDITTYLNFELGIPRGRYEERRPVAASALRRARVADVAAFSQDLRVYRLGGGLRIDLNVCHPIFFQLDGGLEVLDDVAPVETTELNAEATGRLSAAVGVDLCKGECRTWRVGLAAEGVVRRHLYGTSSVDLHGGDWQGVAAVSVAFKNWPRQLTWRLRGFMRPRFYRRYGIGVSLSTPL